jgi:hypothetical protein
MSNEFGLKVFDFESNSKKCKIKNVVAFIDKRYIKKVIASDIQFIMEIDNPDYKVGKATKRGYFHHTLEVKYRNQKKMQRFPSGEIQYKNKKSKLTYSLKKML